MSELRKIGLSEVARHTSKGSLWMVVHNDVLDVTAFVDEHPGGAQFLLDNAGTDATFAFEDAGHSHDARELAQKYKIGWLPPEERMRFKDTCPDELVNRVLCNKESTSVSCAYAKQVEDKDVKSKRKSAADRKYRTPPSKTSESTQYANPHNLYNQPRRPERPRTWLEPEPPPESSGKWKYALMLLAVALIAGIAYKKYS